MGTKEDYCDTVIQAMKDGEEEFDCPSGIRVRLLLSFRRTEMYNDEETRELVDLALKYKEKGEKYVVGVELSGDPRVGDFENYLP